MGEVISMRLPRSEAWVTPWLLVELQTYAQKKEADREKGIEPVIATLRYEVFAALLAEVSFFRQPHALEQLEAAAMDSARRAAAYAELEARHLELMNDAGALRRQVDDLSFANNTLTAAAQSAEKELRKLREERHDLANQLMAANDNLEAERIAGREQAERLGDQITQDHDALLEARAEAERARHVAAGVSLHMGMALGALLKGDTEKAREYLQVYPETVGADLKARLAEFEACAQPGQNQLPDTDDVPSLKSALLRWRAGARMANKRAREAVEEMKRARDAERAALNTVASMNEAQGHLARERDTWREKALDADKHPSVQAFKADLQTLREAVADVLFRSPHNETFMFEPEKVTPEVLASVKPTVQRLLAGHEVDVATVAHCGVEG